MAKKNFNSFKRSIRSEATKNEVPTAPVVANEEGVSQRIEDLRRKKVEKSTTIRVKKSLVEDYKRAAKKHRVTSHTKLMVDALEYYLELLKK